MLELLGAAAAVIAFLSISYVLGRQRKREGLAWLQAQPGNVSRLYLRADPETGTYWLHAEMRNGKKRPIAAPWEVEETLRKLAPTGLRLSAEDRAVLDAALVRGAVRPGNSGSHEHRTDLRGSAQI